MYIYIYIHTHTKYISLCVYVYILQTNEAGAPLARGIRDQGKSSKEIL